MNFRTLGVVIVASLTFVGLDASTKYATAQQASDLVGTWAHVSSVNTAADGTKSETFGPAPKGQAIFSNNGQFSIILHRADLPKFASNNRAQGTAEENKAVVAGMAVVYGTYTVDKKDIVLKVEGSIFPNWVGTEQRRPISSFSADELKIANQAGSAGGQNEIIFRRIK